MNCERGVCAERVGVVHSEGSVLLIDHFLFAAWIIMTVQCHPLAILMSIDILSLDWRNSLMETPCIISDWFHNCHHCWLLRVKSTIKFWDVGIGRDI